MDKRYDHLKAEQAAQRLWQDQETYHFTKDTGPLYSIDTPPPTVSGSLHIGHIFSYTQTDIIARYKRMSGYSVFYPMGFDDNGLPTERYVEKKRAVSPFTIGRTAFIEQCLQETQLIATNFRQLWSAMGLSVDWQLQYSTISPSVQKIAQESFIRLYKKGFIYRTFEPALYCTACRTSVAQAELDDIELSSTFNDITFLLDDGTELLVGTTRPELLSSCVALLYHPDDSRYKNLHGHTARVPFFDYPVPMLADELVDPAKGTGLVMCCTFGDKTDILWFKKHQLPYKESFGPDGKWLEHTGPMAGLRAHAARQAIIDTLRQKNILRAQKSIIHSVNVHERCKKEIEYRALAQWFLNILDNKQRFLDYAETINWHPAFMKARYKNWVENIGWDWCLSRQRFFGIPFPVWYCTACKQTYVASYDELPIDPQQTPYNKGICPECSYSPLAPDLDVMDTWNTSSLTPYICYGLYNPEATSVFEDGHLSNFLPMGMRPQAHDIIRTWAFYTIVKTSLHNECIPWKDIVISGHVLGDSKEKLSKSKENDKIAPQKLLAHYPADVIRFWTASGSLGQDVAFSESQLKIGRRLVTKLWNAFLFASEHIDPVNNLLQVPPQLGIHNEWLLHTLSVTFCEYEEAFAAYEFGSALQITERCFWHDYCDNYLELIKDQLFNPEKYTTIAVTATRWTLYAAGLRLLQLYAPYLPHVTETIYQQLYRNKEKVASLHQTNFKVVQTQYSFPQSAHDIRMLLELIAQARKLKTTHELSLKTELASLVIFCSERESLDRIRQHEQLLSGITHARTIEYRQQETEQPHMLETDGVWQAHVTLSSHLD